jgi:hypothetical protein
MAPAAGRIRLTSHTIHPTRPGKPHRPWNARPPSDTGRPVIPTCNNQASQPASTGFIHPNQAARKIEVDNTSFTSKAGQPITPVAYRTVKPVISP